MRRAYEVELKGGDVLVEWWDSAGDEVYRNGTYPWQEGRYFVRITIPLRGGQQYVYECWVSSLDAEHCALYVPGRPSVWTELTQAAIQRWYEHSKEHGLTDGLWHGPDREPV